VHILSVFCTGFLDLASEDQMALLKSSFMELSILRLSYRFCAPLLVCVVCCLILCWRTAVCCVVCIIYWV